MKFRCAHNSIRIRVRKSDLQTLSENSWVLESVQFSPTMTLQFMICIDEYAQQVKARLEGQSISIHVPEERAKQWIESNEVGIEHFQQLEGDSQLHILLEKDFPCLDREEENRNDTFWELAPEQPEAC